MRRALMQVDLTQIFLALIGGLPALVAAVGALLVGLRNSRKVGRVEGALLTVATATDGMKDALVSAAEERGLVAGRAEGAASERSRSTADAVAELLRTSKATGVPVARAVIVDERRNPEGDKPPVD